MWCEQSLVLLKIFKPWPKQRHVTLQCKYSTIGNLTPILCLVFFQQWRLIPYLAAAYALEHFTKSIFMNFVEFQIGQVMRDKSDRQVSEHKGQSFTVQTVSRTGSLFFFHLLVSEHSL